MTATIQIWIPTLMGKKATCGPSTTSFITKDWRGLCSSHAVLSGEYLFCRGESHSASTNKVIFVMIEAIILLQIAYYVMWGWKNTFILHGYIELIKSGSKYIYNVQKIFILFCSFELYQRIKIIFLAQLILTWLIIRKVSLAPNWDIRIVSEWLWNSTTTKKTALPS